MVYLAHNQISASLSILALRRNPLSQTKTEQKTTKMRKMGITQRAEQRKSTIKAYPTQPVKSRILELVKKFSESAK